MGSLICVLVSQWVYLYHEKLGDNVVLDQRWALEAIYKPLKRGSTPYAELRQDYKGIVPVRKLFGWFGTGYSNEDK